jgi:hypothetical protein
MNFSLKSGRGGEPPPPLPKPPVYTLHNPDHQQKVILYSGKFSWGPIFNLQRFRGLIFADVCDHAHYTLHNRTYFAGLIFAPIRESHKN